MKTQQFCCVPKCENIGAFSFPTSSSLILRKLWIEKFKGCMPDNWEPTNKNKLCKAHFLKSDVFSVLRDGKTYQKLKYDAVPCFFPWIKIEKKNKKLKNKKIQDDKSSTEKVDKKLISRYGLEKSLQYLSGEIPVDFQKYDSLRYCNKDSTQVVLSTSTPNAMLDEMRSALLQHQWDEVASMLPSLFNARNAQYVVWRAALQVFCHHPNSSADLLKDFLKTCLHINSISVDILDKIFCTARQLPTDSECDEDSVGGETSELVITINDEETTQ